MIRDFIASPPDSVIEADLCIVGAGAAGISMALRFVGRRERVVVLESGGLDFEPEVQALYEGEVIGLPYYDLDATRLRFLGGTTNHWAGYSVPLQPIDFERRPWVPHSGWPIGYADLEPWYREAHPLLELGPFDYDVARIVPHLPELDRQRLVNCLLRLSPPTRFGDRYRRELEQADAIEVVLHANATVIETNENRNHVTGVRLATLGGATGLVRAKRYVLACGGLENARLLLDNGLGNDHVGRFFMEHLHVQSGILAVGRATDAYRYSERNGITVEPAVCTSSVPQREHQMLNLLFVLDRLIAAPNSKGYEAVKELVLDLGEDGYLDRMPARIRDAITDLGGIAGGIYTRLFLSDAVGVHARSEQAPNRDSRVLLSEDRDALGQRRIQLDWRLSDLDKTTVVTATELFAREVGRLNLGRIQVMDWLGEDGWPISLVGGHHHMGTTRMADGPDEGVVDANCRMFGTDNMYIAGGSVFTTSGYANPTLTIVALALRLADHLQT